MSNTRNPFEPVGSIEITTSYGTEYKFVEYPGIFGGSDVHTYSKWDGQWHKITKFFKSLDEARQWIAELEEQHNAPQPEPKPLVIPDGYYGVPGRYYGD